MPFNISTPDLSIIIPTYNRLPLLKEALDSFVGKLTCSYEVIIVDDGSTDGTPDYLRTLGEPFRVFFQEHKGSNATRNHGMREARGRYIKFLDSDDLISAQNVFQQVMFLDEHPEYDVCYSDMTRLYPDGKEVCVPNYQVKSPIDEILSPKWWHCTVHAFLVRSELARCVKWDLNVHRYQEMDFQLRLAVGGARYAYLSGNAGWHRAHNLPRVSDAEYAGAQAKFTMYENAQVLLEQAGKLTDERRKLLAHRYFQYAEHVFLSDRQKYRDILMNRVLAIWPTFEPRRPRFRLLVRILGYEMAEWVRILVRRPTTLFNVRTRQ